MPSFHTTNPATEQSIAEYAFASESVIEQTIDQAYASWSNWRSQRVAQRTEPLARLAKLLMSQQETLAQLMTKEMGKPIQESRAEIKKCALACDYYVANAEQMLADRNFHNDRVKGKVVLAPLGVIYVIMPWNFPFWQVIRFIAPHLTAGNVGILKHAPGVAGCAAAIADLLIEAGYPPGVFANLYAETTATESILADRRIAGVTLTGSSQAGKTVASLAGKHMKKGVFELGGSDPYVVLADADIEQAAKACATARLLNSGQSCIAAKRFLVHRSVHDEFVSALVGEMAAYGMGDPTLDTTKVGPLARLDLRDQLADQVSRSVNDGAKIVLGGNSQQPGYFFEPTILTHVEPGQAVFDEETFGPVAAVTSCPSDDAALDFAARTPYGLGAAIFSGNTERAELLARTRLHAGNCAINTFVKSDPAAPFGGIKESGYGRELGTFGLHEFLNIKSLISG